jgi:nickel-dependent lactate racemase
MKYTEVRLPVGKNTISASIPNLMKVALPKEVEGVDDERAEVRRALENPIASPKLRDIVRAKSAKNGAKNAAIVVNDITRPYPGKLLVEEIVKELKEGGLEDGNIFLVVAYGMHRRNTIPELTEMFGKEVIERFRLVHHDGADERTLVSLGKTSGGVDVNVNKEFAAADIKILTGLITPHQSAGFAGGRKSVMPGIAGLSSLRTHHSFPIRPNRPSMGWLEGNPFHEEALKAARIAGVDFIVNAIDNVKREMVKVVAGDLNEAHLKGVAVCRDIWTVELDAKADVVIVSPGGYPRDFDLHQSQKACACAELACKEGGEIILCAEVPNGAGKFAQRLKDATHPREVVDKYTAEGYTAESTAKAYMYARALLSHRIGLACSRIPADEIGKMFMIPYKTIDDGIKDAIGHYGENASFIAIPYASDIILSPKK